MIPALQKNLLKSIFEVRVTDAHKPSNILLKKAQEKEKRRSISRTLAAIMERNKILQKQIPRSGRSFQSVKR
ncbi:hypothetical protein [uncultured Bartonella sp.]|uniref:hypothetical protein n=1 Tax=uncultured Bartonella sp. TaxID=104108 RepID=UPI0025F7BB0B|nr:hypothetical protein [uncultured Bartonella sp.]